MSGCSLLTVCVNYRSDAETAAFLVHHAVDMAAMQLFVRGERALAPLPEARWARPQGPAAASAGPSTTAQTPSVAELAVATHACPVSQGASTPTVQACSQAPASHTVPGSQSSELVHPAPMDTPPPNQQ